MKNRLASVRAGVNHEAVSNLIDLFLHGQNSNYREHLSQEKLIFPAKFLKGDDVSYGHNQDVRRGDWLDILQSNYRFVAIN